jgi:adenosylcobinamide-GDP ribazoletransferase
MTHLNDFKVAAAFLTRVKVVHSDEVDIARSAKWFPFVGLAIGVSSSTVLLFLASILPFKVATCLTLIFSVFVTGAFHQDGLADIFDGLVGGWNQADRLRILKDSRHGTYGVLAIVLQTILQYAVLSSFTLHQALIAVTVSHALARLVPLFLMQTKAVPGHEGMGAQSVAKSKRSDVILPTTISVLFLVIICGLHVLGLAIALVITNLIFLRYVRARIGGVLGDAFGAAEQISEDVILLYFLIIFYNAIGLSWLI